MTARVVFGLGWVVAASLLAPDALAQEHVEERIVVERDVVSSSARTMLGDQGAIWLEMGFTGGGPNGEEVFVASPEVGLRYRVTDAIVADVSWGMTFAEAHVRGEATISGTPTPYDASVVRVEPANPTLGGAFVHRSPELLLEIGLSVGIPAATRADLGADLDGAIAQASSRLAQRSTMAMRGYRAAFRWAPERFSLALPFRIIFPVAPIFIEVDGALALMLPVLGDQAADADTLVELGAGVGAEVVGPLALGVRLSGVGAATGAMAPPFTFSAEPWARLRFDPVQITARGVLLLSGDDGLGQGRGPSFGVLVGAGVEL